MMVLLLSAPAVAGDKQLVLGAHANTPTAASLQVNPVRIDTASPNSNQSRLDGRRRERELRSR